MPGLWSSASSNYGPKIIHVLTKKGQGYDAALKQPERFHGVGPYDVATGAPPAAKPGTPPSYHEVFGQTVVKLCQRDSRLVGITAATMVASARHRGVRLGEKPSHSRAFVMSGTRRCMSSNPGP